MDIAKETQSLTMERYFLPMFRDISLHSAEERDFVIFKNLSILEAKVFKKSCVDSTSVLSTICPAAGFAPLW